MPPASKNKPLDWSKRALADLDRIYDYYLEAAPYDVAEQAIAAITGQARRIAELNLVFRPGRHDTREAVVPRFPYTIVYRIEPAKLRIVRVLHQSRDYFSH